MDKVDRPKSRRIYSADFTAQLCSHLSTATSGGSHQAGRYGAITLHLADQPHQVLGGSLASSNTGVGSFARYSKNPPFRTPAHTLTRIEAMHSIAVFCSEC